jgi:hypothetical protein
MTNTNTHQTHTQHTTSKTTCISLRVTTLRDVQTLEDKGHGLIYSLERQERGLCTKVILIDPKGSGLYTDKSRGEN